jgi:AraC-like DNA-binding protein
MRHFNLADGEPSSRVDILDEAARNSSVPFRARPADPGRTVSFRHLDRYFGGVNVTRTALDNFHGVRPARLARRDPAPRLILTVSTGPYAVEQNDRMLRRPTGSMVPYWSRDAMRLWTDEPVLAWSVTVMMDELGVPHRFLRDVLVRNVGRSPLGPLVRTYLTELAALPELPPEQAAALAYPTLDLLRALLTTAGGDEFLSRQPLGRTLGMRIMLYLRAHATDPDLSAGKVAAHFGISKRYLYAVLARMDVPLGEWIRTERLNRAARDLADPADALTPVAVIARRSGFAEHSSFSRAFKQRYGCTPSEWRHLTEAEREVRRRTSPTLAELAQASENTRD